MNARAQQLTRWGKALSTSTPRLSVRWLGALRRRWAVSRLVRHRDDPEAARWLAEACEHPTPKVRAAACAGLLRIQDAAAIDAVCDWSIERPSSVAARLCIRAGWRPQCVERACLFLFVTGQLDAYFSEDYEFQNLRLEFERATPRVKSHILKVLRSGDQRCLGFFTQQKPLVDLSDGEIRVAIRSFVRHEDWARLFRAFLDLPLKYGLPILEELRRAGWEPDEPELASLLRQALEDTRGEICPRAQEPAYANRVVESWLAVGREPPLSHGSVEELLEVLRDAPPPRAVAAVGALATKTSPGSQAAENVSEHPHWLVRLAGCCVGLCGEVTSDEPASRFHWFDAIAPRLPLLELAPAKCTPAVLEDLAAAPAAAWGGATGPARKVLRGLLAYRMTCGTFAPMTVPVDTTAAEWVPIE